MVRGTKARCRVHVNTVQQCALLERAQPGPKPLCLLRSMVMGTHYFLGMQCLDLVLLAVPISY